jgi:ribosomal protein L23
VKDVKTAIMRGKPKKTMMKGGRFEGKRPDRKKAYVKIAKGQNIDIFDQV